MLQIHVYVLRYIPPPPPRYGFHGTSYKYLTAKAAQMLGKPESEVNLVICHLGGCGRCVLLLGVCFWRDKETCWRTGQMLGKPEAEVNLVICHLGGCRGGQGRAAFGCTYL